MAKIENIDDVDLGETIILIDVSLSFANGFICSDNDHARQIRNWLIELSKFRADRNSAATTCPECSCSDVTEVGNGHLECADCGWEGYV